MPRKKQARVDAAARARLARQQKSADPDSHSPREIVEDTPAEECGWDGTLNHALSSDSEFCWTDSEWAGTSDDDDSDISELEGDELYQHINHQLELEIQELTNPTPYQKINETARGMTSKDWKKVESGYRVYSGNSQRTKQRREQTARKKEETDKVSRKSCVPSPDQIDQDKY